MSASSKASKQFGFATVIFLSVGPAYGQAPSDFFPHHVGDLWEYHVLNGVGDDTLQVRVVRDSMDTDGFYHVTHERQLVNPRRPANFCWYEEFVVDTLPNVYASGCFSYNRLQYRLDANLHDLWIVEDLETAYNIARIEDVYADTIFGMPTIVQSISYYFTEDTSDTTIWLFQYQEGIASGFGTVYRVGSDLGYALYILGAVIDGVQYGDTTVVVAVEDNPDPSNPAEVHLYQNYPNPFNPKTEIGYHLPAGQAGISDASWVTLTIYDILGREIATLVDEKQEAGFREVEWDATGQPSGIYFYRLQTRTFVETRKLVLLR